MGPRKRKGGASRKGGTGKAKRKVSTKVTSRSRRVPKNHIPRTPWGSGSKVSAAVLSILGGSLLLISVLVPWGNMDVNTKIGPIPVSLKADVYEYGVSYEADLSASDGGLAIGGNMGGKISEDRVFLTGLGEFQETVGFVKGSSKVKNHTIELYTLPDNNRAVVLIETHADNIPWWPVGVKQDVSVTVKIIEPPVNISHVLIKRVWIEIHRQVDGEDLYKIVYTKDVQDKISKFDDSKTYDAKIVAEEDMGAFSVVGRAEIELIDKDGRSNDGKEIRSYSGNPKMIDLWTISQERTARIVMMIIAFPMTVIGSILLMLSTVPLVLRKRWAWKTALFSSVLTTLSVIFYMLGVYALIDLTGYIDWFNWNLAGPGIASMGAILGYLSVALIFRARPIRARRPHGRPVRKRSMKIEEEAEEIPVDGPDRPEALGGSFPFDDE